ncbi:hypothetical protein D3C72_531490 [compost metagenome]
MLPPANPAAKLMKLGQAEPVGVHNNHQRGVRHVYADLDHGRRDEELHLVRIELAHHFFLLGRRHPAVQQTHLEIGEGLGHRHIEVDSILHIQLLGLLNQRADEVSLTSLPDLTRNEPKHPIHFVVLDPVRRNRLSSFGPLRQRRHIHIAKSSNGQRPGNRRSRHRQDIRVEALSPQNAALIHTEPVLFICNDKT